MPTIEDLNGIYLGDTEVQSVYLGTQEIWTAEVGPTPIDTPPTKYLTFTSTGGNRLSLENYASNSPKIYYSTDLTNWYRWDYSAISIPNGQSIYLCGINKK